MRRLIGLGAPLVLCACRGVLGISTLTYDGGVDAREAKDVTTQLDTGVDAGVDAGEDSTTPPRDAGHDVERDSGHDGGEHDSDHDAGEHDSGHDAGEHDSGHDAGMPHPDGSPPPDGGCFTNCVNQNPSEVPSFLMSFANLGCRCNSCDQCNSTTCQPASMGPQCPMCVAELVVDDGGACNAGPLSCATSSCQALVQCIHTCP